MEFLQNVTENDLPSNSAFDTSKCEPGTYYIRCRIQNLKDAAEWLETFASNTSTQWRTWDSKPNASQKIVCQKKWVCHHSAYAKKALDEYNNNKRGASKNTGCLAEIVITVKVTTPYTKRTDPFIKNGMPGIVHLRARHNHPLVSPSALKCLSTPKSVRDQFHEYFSMGMMPSVASNYHENKLLFEDDVDLPVQDSDLPVDDKEVLLDHARYNPTKRTVKYWFERWKNLQYGPKDGSNLETILNQKIASYASQGVTVRYVNNEQDPFALVVITPIMERIHQCSFSKDVLFVDTTSACDHENTSITFLLSVTPCGAVPCGVLITKEQTKAAFTTGFKLLQEVVSEKLGTSFGGQNYPTVLMTDNCSAEIGGALAIWLDSISLLCVFHVLQYVLHWLQDSAHHIPKEHQRDLISTFQTILYCTDINEAENAFESAMAVGGSFPQWQNYLQDQYNSKEKWCLAYRKGLTGHHTNNYAEISIRLFKENVLNRVKAYNFIALLDFIASTMELFYKRKLREFFNSRDRRNHLYLQYLLKNAAYIRKENIVVINEHTYEVPSENDPATMYIVNREQASCNCKAGQMQKLCKHFAAVFKFFDVRSNIIPDVTIEGRRTMAFVALGKDNMPPFDYFLPLHVNELTQNEREESAKENCDPSVNNNHPEAPEQPSSVCTDNTLAPNDVPVQQPLCGNVSYTFEEFLDVQRKLYEQYGATDSINQGITKATSRLLKIRSTGQWSSYLHTVGKSIPLRRATGAKIKVQPTAISRRKASKSRLPVAIKRRGRIHPKKGEKHSISTCMYA
ncbi:uncharacterized protein LOC135836577 [Planococcus citri]|uniref:uncharacterized protein LOC135836577 n=1 Tax=Planococcus citri TaxID=170843 RepID=UPI0031F7F96B